MEKKTSKELQIFLKNSKIVCQIKGQDRYKRKIAICFKNSIDINAWLVKEGLAVAYKKYSRRYSNFEKQARDQKKVYGMVSSTCLGIGEKKKINYSSNSDS